MGHSAWDGGRGQGKRPGKRDSLLDGDWHPRMTDCSLTFAIYCVDRADMADATPHSLALFNSVCFPTSRACCALCTAAVHMPDLQLAGLPGNSAVPLLFSSPPALLITQKISVSKDIDAPPHPTRGTLCLPTPHTSVGPSQCAAWIRGA